MSSKENQFSNENAHNEEKNTQTTQQDHSEPKKKDEQIKSCCKELGEVRDRCLYLTAEFENFKKRIEKERLHWILNGESFVLKNLLEIVDDFERALQEINREKLSQELLVHLNGFNIISKSLHKLLEKFDVRPIQDNQFNPELHEAIGQVDSNTHKSGEIVEILKKGYTHKGILLRVGQVIVAK
jgi:molecular chaperone GrpE